MDWTPGLTLQKDPDAVLDYVFKWDDFLGSDTIQSKTVTVESGLTKDSDSITDANKRVTVWLSGGAAGTTYSVKCRIVTAGGRTDERTINIAIKQK